MHRATACVTHLCTTIEAMCVIQAKGSEEEVIKELVHLFNAVARYRCLQLTKSETACDGSDRLLV